MPLDFDFVSDSSAASSFLAAAAATATEHLPFRETTVAFPLLLGNKRRVFVFVFGTRTVVATLDTRPVIECRNENPWQQPQPQVATSSIATINAKERGIVTFVAIVVATTPNTVVLR